MKKPNHCTTLDDQLVKSTPPPERPVLLATRVALVDWGSQVYPAIILADGRAVVIDPSQMRPIRKALSDWLPIFYADERTEKATSTATPSIFGSLAL